MMTGYGCNWIMNITDEMLHLAIQRVHQAAFVGDTDEWDSSICLFHSMFGGEMNPHSFQNVRPTLVAGYNHSASFELTPEDDPWDWQFYLAAKTVMRKHQEIYGMPTYVPPPLHS